MATVPATPSVVVIGAGIVGNSLVYHLARLGWRDIVQIDKGPLPNPGGSTGHASNFIFPVDHSREITDLTLDSMRQYKEMGVFTESGGFEVARTEERMEELRRRMSSAQGLGHRGRRSSRPSSSRRRCPFLETDQYHRRVLDARASASSTRCGPARSCASARWRRGALTVVPERRGHRPRRRATAGSAAVRTDRRRHRGRARRHRLRRLEPEDRRHGRASHPADARGAPDDQRRPVPAARRARGRDLLPDRPRHGHASATSASTARDMEVGSYAHRAILHGARGHPVDRAGQAVARPRCRSPTTTSTRSSSRRSS